MIVECPQCQAKYRLDETKFTAPEKRLKCTKCENIFTVYKPGSEPAAAPPAAAAPPPAPPAAPQQQAAPAAPSGGPPDKVYGPDGGKLVIVAVSEMEMVKKLGKFLMNNSYRVVMCTDGVNAEQRIKKYKPAAAVIEVNLPAKLGAQVSESIKASPDTAGTKIVLLPNHHDEGKYRRDPTNLYGADAFIERSQIGKELMPKLAELLAGGGGAPAPAPAAAPSAPAPAAPTATATSSMYGADDENLPPEHKSAKRLARIIASDIALYNPEAIEQGIREGNLFELLAKDISEAKELYNSRVDDAIRSETSYLKEAFQALIEKKKRELGLA